MTKRPITTISTDFVSVAPSVLAADFCDLGRDIRAAEDAGADAIHLDIMDGHFVPNISMGPPVVKSVRSASSLPFDVHLMLTNPDRFIDAFTAAGGDHITIHVESDADIAATLGRIREAGCSAGLSLKPGTSADTLRPYLGLVDLILVMTVEPGFGGQAFRRDVLLKMARVRDMVREVPQPVHLEVDGGISRETAADAVNAGCNMLVAGTTVFRHPDGLRRGIELLRVDRGA